MLGEQEHLPSEEGGNGVDPAKQPGKKQKIRKRSIYLPEDMAEEIQGEADRLDRSPTWLLLRAWAIAKIRLMKLPTEEDPRKPRH